MPKIVLKTADRGASISREAVRDAIAAVFLTARSSVLAHTPANLRRRVIAKTKPVAREAVKQAI